MKILKKKATAVKAQGTVTVDGNDRRPGDRDVRHIGQAGQKARAGAPAGPIGSQSMAIHPTAIVDPLARIHPDAEIGPYCIIGAEVEIGARHAG